MTYTSIPYPGSNYCPHKKLWGECCSVFDAPKQPITVYIASPYTKGDPQENTDRSFDCALDLIEAGFAPYAPLYSHYLHLRRPQDYHVWTKLDLIWVLKCDALLRLPGESSGADAEVRFAQENNIPVFYDVAELIEWKKWVEE